MSVKSEIIHILEQCRGERISGQELAERLGVSRTAVWKAINSLKDEGYMIDGVSNKGYSLSTQSDVLSSEGIRPFLKQKYSHIPISVYKGRMGRNFYSPSESGIYMSIILKPQLNVSDSVLITTAAAVAVCLAVDSFTDLTPEIKWVNDIYINNKKVCGILTEAVTDMESGTVSSVVVGIGLNVKTELFPTELEETAGSVFNPSDDSFIRNRIAAEIINNVLSVCENLEDRSFLSIYRERSMILGENVRYCRNGQWSECYAQDIDEYGGLVVFHEDGSKEVLHSGEISLRKK